MSIPNGYKFYLPELKWSAPGNFPSFTVVANALEEVIKANPHLAQKHQWPTDRAGIENWVDAYNAALCAQMGWNDYITQGESHSFPKSQPPQQNLQSLAAAAAMAKELIAGAKSLSDWEDSHDPAVPRDLAQSRAAICVACPKNEAGDWTRWFTAGAAELIRRKVEKAQARSLSTIHDERLHLCSACHCPLKLKVHVPINWIVKRLSNQTRSKLLEAPACWVLKEEAGK